MRFTVAAAFLATGAMATKPIYTDYTTKLVTVTDCGPDVPYCPAHSTHIQTSHVPVTTSTVYTSHVVTVTDCGPEVPDCPAHSTIVSTETVPVSTTVCEVPTDVPQPPPGNGTVPVPPPTETPGPVPTVCVPSHSTTAITKSYTTVLTSVEYSTIEIPCETETPIPSVTLAPPPPAGNTTVPTGPVPTGGAGSLAGSAFFAAAAGLAAFILA